MGILADALSIILGSFLGSRYREKITFKNFSVLGISIMIISMVGFLENIFTIGNGSFKSTGLMLVVFSLITGSWIGDIIHIDEKLSSLSNCRNNNLGFFIDTTLFFGIGGLQISGPVILALTGDSSQLFLKSIIDFPFALMFGMSYGAVTGLSAFPVALCQLFIAICAYFLGDFLSPAIVSQLCAMGYIVLFFTGFNMICDKGKKINNTNMIIGIFMVIIFNFWGMAL